MGSQNANISANIFSSMNNKKSYERLKVCPNSQTLIKNAFLLSMYNYNFTKPIAQWEKKPKTEFCFMPRPTCHFRNEDGNPTLKGPTCRKCWVEQLNSVHEPYLWMRRLRQSGSQTPTGSDCRLIPAKHLNHLVSTSAQKNNERKKQTLIPLNSSTTTITQ